MGTMGPPPCRRKTCWPQCNANSWMIKTAFLFLSHCTLQTAPRSDNSHLSNEDRLNMAVVKNSEPLSGLQTFNPGFFVPD